MGKLGVVVLVVLAAAGAAIWFLNGRASVKALPPPELVDVMLLDASGAPRPVTGEPTLGKNEALDFHVQLTQPAFVYVFRSVSNKAVLEWGPEADGKKLDPGVWAPEWQDITGLHFSDGDATLYVIAAPEKLEKLREWTSGDLQTPKVRCPACGVSSLGVHVARIP